MKKPSLVKTIIQALIGSALICALLLLLAGSLYFRLAWILAPVLAIPATLSGYYYAKKVPGLLGRRKVDWKKLPPKRKGYMSFVYAAELSLLVVPALDARFGWSHMPFAVSMAGNALILAANAMWVVSKTANPYAGSAITIYEGHRLIKTGPYSVVRHPNYVGDLLLNLGMPLALGSWWGAMIFALIVPAQVYMIFDEESFLRENLPGYKGYMKETRSRLIPHIW